MTAAVRLPLSLALSLALSASVASAETPAQSPPPLATPPAPVSTAPAAPVAATPTPTAAPAPDPAAIEGDAARLAASVVADAVSDSAVLPDPLEAAGTARMLEGLRDGGFALDDAPVLRLLDVVSDLSPADFRVARRERPAAWIDLVERPSSFRGRLVVIDGSLVDARAWERPDGRKVVQATVEGRDVTQRFTVLLPEDPGDRNVRVRLKGYFARVRETGQRDAAVPLLVARTWQKVPPPAKPASAAQSEDSAKAADGAPRPGPKLGSDGLPLEPDFRTKAEIEKYADEFKDDDDKVAVRALYLYADLVSGLSKDTFRAPADDPYTPLRYLVTWPDHYRWELVTVEGVVRKISEVPDPKRVFGQKVIYEATLSHEDTNRSVYTVYLTEKPENPGIPFRVRFKAYFIKNWVYQSKEGQRQGPVLVGKTWQVVTPEVVERSSAGAALKELFTGWTGTVVVIVIGLLLAARVVLAVRKVGNEPVGRGQLAPADPLLSREVIDSLAAMPGNDSPFPADHSQSSHPGLNGGKSHPHPDDSSPGLK
jgi:hypothetical protein